MTRIQVSIVKKPGYKPGIAVVRTLESGGRKMPPSLFKGAQRRVIEIPLH